MRQTTLAVHDPWVSNLDAAEHRPDLACSGLIVNLRGCEVQALQMNPYVGSHFSRENPE